MILQWNRNKLPKVEILKFSGDIKEWLGFRDEFKKMYEDIEDKSQYLSQVRVIGSRVRDIINSFPPSA